MEQKKKPDLQLIIEFRNKKFTVDYPSNAKMIDSAVYAARLSQNVDTLQSFSYLFGDMPYFTIEAIACGEKIIGEEFKKLMRVENMLDLRPDETKDFVDLFKNKIMPWFVEWREYLSTPIEG